MHHSGKSKRKFRRLRRRLAPTAVGLAVLAVIAGGIGWQLLRGRSQRHRSKAEVALQYDQPRTALTHALQALENSPDDLEALLLAAKAHMRLGQSEQAYAALRTLVDISPDPAGARELMAEWALCALAEADSADRHSRAMETAAAQARWFAANGHEEYSRVLTARIQLARGRQREADASAAAEEVLTRTVADDPQAFEAWRMLLVMFAEGQQAERLFAAAGRLAQMEQLPPELAALAAETLLDVTAPLRPDLPWQDRARRLHERSRRGAAPDATWRLRSARLAAATGDLSQAEFECRTGLAERPDNLALKLMLAEVLYARGRFAEAEPLLRTLDGPNDQFARTRQMRAIALMQTDQLREAEGICAAAVSADPSDPAARLLLARTLLMQGQPDQAQTHALIAAERFDHLLSRSRELGPVAHELAGRFCRAGRIDPAIALLEQLHRQVGPWQLDATNDLAVLLAEYRPGQLSRAWRLASAVCRIQPNNPGYLDTLGWIEHLRGRSEVGATYLRRAVATAPDDPQLRRRLREAELAVVE